MNGCQEFIQNIANNLPDVCTVKDLVKVGVHKSAQAAHYARRKKDCPNYFKIPGRGIVYPKSSVIEFLEKKKNTSL